MGCLAAFLDEVRQNSVRSQSATGGPAIPHVDPASAAGTGGDFVSVGSGRSAESATHASDRASEWSWDRLERAVTLLAEEQQRLREELRAARRELSDREQRIRRYEAQLLEANQRRQDTGKRIDELISQLDQLDATLSSMEPAE